MKLKELRKSTGKTQIEVAKDLGISQQNYCRYENGQHEPDLETLKRIADYFHTTTDFLIDHEVPYLINKSQFSNEQLDILEKIKNLDKEQCKIIISYIDGLNDGKILKK